MNINTIWIVVAGLSAGCGGSLPSTNGASEVRPVAAAAEDQAGERAGTAAGSEAGSAAAGQSAGVGTGANAAPVYELEGMRIAVAGRDAEGEPNLVAYDAQSLLDRGNDALARGLPEAASAQYQQLLREFPDSRLRAAAIFNLGLAAEVRGDVDAAVGYYEQLAFAGGGGPEVAHSERESLDAHMRIAAVQAEDQRWAAARQTLERLLERAELSPDERVEGMARLGYVALAQGDDAYAETVLGDALAYYNESAAALERDDFVAMSRYYFAQVPHRQLLVRPMRLPQEQLKRDLDAKAALLTLAYDRYVAVLELDAPYWSTAAGYQMSQLYKQFWDDIIAAPIPSELSPQAAGYYRRELRAQVRGFLEKAMAGHLRNVELAEVYAASTVWSRESEQRARELGAILAGAGAAAPYQPAAGDAEPALPDGNSGALDISGYAPARAEL